MTKRTRGFEVISKYQDANINLPVRSTYHSAGYDIEAAETITIPSLFRQFKEGKSDRDASSYFPSTLVPTGLKAYMLEDEYLQIINRSSNPLKRNLVLPNSVGIIDQDYYNNPDNEGHIYVQLINYSMEDIVIQKGERIAQGIFTKYYVTDTDHETSNKQQRTGGFGSTGE